MSDKHARVQRRAEKRKAARIEQERKAALKRESDKLKKELSAIPKAHRLGKRSR